MRTMLLACVAIAAPLPFLTENSLADASNDSGRPIRGEASAPMAPATSAAVPVGPPPPSEPVDERALRYYAAQHDATRVEAEVRRLSLRHPGWHPPADLDAPAEPPVDEQALWDLLSAGRLEELEANIQTLRKDRPGWQPPEALVAAAQAARARRELVAASDAQDWAGTLAAAEKAPSLLSCSDLDAFWRVAEARVRTGQVTEAVATYRTILAQCTAPADRLATAQKASLLLDEATTATLLASDTGADDGDVFQPVRADLARRRVAAALSGTGKPPSAGQIALLKTNAQQARDAGDLELLGWWELSQASWSEAEELFRASFAITPGAKSAEGLILAQRNAGKVAEAEETAWRSRSLGPQFEPLFVEIVSAQLTGRPRPALTPERMDRFASIVETRKSALGAQSLGWYLLGRNELRRANSWFRNATDWEASEESVLGLAITFMRLGDRRELAAVMKEYRATYRRVAELDAVQQDRRDPRVRLQTGTQARAAALAEEAVRQFKAQHSQAALALLDERLKVAPEPRGLSILRGWALLQEGDRDAARRVFSDVDAVDSTAESREGLREVEAREYRARMVLMPH